MQSSLSSAPRTSLLQGTKGMGFLLAWAPEDICGFLRRRAPACYLSAVELRKSPPLPPVPLAALPNKNGTGTALCQRTPCAPFAAPAQTDREMCVVEQGGQALSLGAFLCALTGREGPEVPGPRCSSLLTHPVLFAACRPVACRPSMHRRSLPFSRAAPLCRRWSKCCGQLVDGGGCYV